jgi:GTP-binding protein HflX
MLSDTVGFVRDLPTNLIASFRATLEEATHADLLLIVLDVADPAAKLQYETVNNTLEELFSGRCGPRSQGGQSVAGRRNELVLLNKVDRLPDNRELLIWQQLVPGSIPISGRSTTHAGQTMLRERVAAAARGQIEELRITVPLSDAKTIHIIENRATVLGRDYDGDTVTLHARIGKRQLEQLRSLGSRWW